MRPPLRLPTWREPRVIEPREYVRLIAAAYVAAPTGGEEEELLDNVLVLACERYGLDAPQIVEELVRERGEAEVRS